MNEVLYNSEMIYVTKYNHLRLYPIEIVDQNQLLHKFLYHSTVDFSNLMGQHMLINFL